MPARALAIRYSLRNYTPRPVRADTLQGTGDLREGGAAAPPAKPAPANPASPFAALAALQAPPERRARRRPRRKPAKSPAREAG